MTTRVIAGILGVLSAAYGFVLLLQIGLSNLVATSTWLVGGVVLHDAVLAPATILVCTAAMAAGAWRAPLAAGLLVLGTVTITAIPVLSGRGERPDNPTLLDRDYRLGWLVVLVLVGLGVVVARLASGWLDARRSSGADGDADEHDSAPT